MHSFFLLGTMTSESSSCSRPFITSSRLAGKLNLNLEITSKNNFKHRDLDTKFLEENNSYRSYFRCSHWRHCWNQSRHKFLTSLPWSSHFSMLSVKELRPPVHAWSVLSAHTFTRFKNCRENKKIYSNIHKSWEVAAQKEKINAFWYVFIDFDSLLADDSLRRNYYFFVTVF